MFRKVVLATIFQKGSVGKKSGLKILGEEINSFPKKLTYLSSHKYKIKNNTLNHFLSNLW